MTTTSEVWTTFYWYRTVSFSMQGGWSRDSFQWGDNFDDQWLFRVQGCFHLFFLIQERRKNPTEFIAVLWAMCHLGLGMEVHVAIVSTPKAGKAVQGDHQNLQIQGAVWGKEDRCPKLVGELFNCSGHSALSVLSGLVFKNDCSPFLMPLVSQMKLMPRSFQRPCH